MNDSPCFSPLDKRPFTCPMSLGLTLKQAMVPTAQMDAIFLEHLY